MTPTAKAPTKGSAGAAGYDLHSAYDYSVKPGGKLLIKTDLQLIFPPGTYGRIASKSSLAWKAHMSIGGGVVDNDFRGNVSVIVFNHSSCNLRIITGAPIAQIICEKYEITHLAEIPHNYCVAATKRGDRGLGRNLTFK